MAIDNTHRPKAELFAALANGRRKAQMFLIGVKTLDESSLILRFIANSSQKEYEMKKTDSDDLRIDDLISTAMSPTIAKSLEEKAGIQTLQDLLSSDARTVRSVLAEEEVHLQEIVLAMLPNRVSASWIAYVE